MTDRIKQFKGVLVWVMVAGIILVALTIVAVNLLDRLVIERAAAENLNAEFLGYDKEFKTEGVIVEYTSDCAPHLL